MPRAINQNFLEPKQPSIAVIEEMLTERNKNTFIC